MYMIYGGLMDVAIWLSQSSSFRRCRFVHGLTEHGCCYSGSLVNVMFPKLLHYNLNFVTLSFALCLGFQNAHIIIIPKKKNLPGLIQKWGRVLIGVKSPTFYSVNLNFIWITYHAFPKEKQYPLNFMNSVSNTFVWIGLLEFTRAMPRLSRIRSLNRW